MTNNLNRKAWTVLWAAIIINFFSGLGYIWSIIGKELMGQLGWTSLQSSLPYTVFTVAFALSMAISGPLQDRKGPRFVSTLGSILIGVGLILTGFALKPMLMVLTYGVMTGFGIGSMYAATIPPAIKWFPPQKKGMVNGITVAMVALASVMYSPLIKVLMGNFGISPSFWAIGIGTLIILTGFSQLLSNPPEDLHVSKDAASKPAQVELGPKDVIRNVNFYKMWFMFTLSAASSLMVIGHAANIAIHQASWEGGFILVILIAVFNACGRFFGGSLSDRIGRPNLIRLTFIIQAANIILFTLYTNYLILMLGVAIAGLCYGSTMVVFSASTSDLFGMKNFGANYGLVYTAWGIAGVLGPIPSAMIFDATGSFNYAFFLSAGLVVIALIISFTFSNKLFKK